MLNDKEELMMLANRYEALYNEVAGNYVDIELKYEKFSVKKRFWLVLAAIAIVLPFPFLVYVNSAGGAVVKIIVGSLLGISICFGIFTMWFGSRLKWLFPMCNKKAARLLQGEIDELIVICDQVRSVRHSLARQLSKYELLQSIITCTLHGECELCERLQNFHVKVKLKDEDEWKEYRITSQRDYDDLAWKVARALEIQRIDNDKEALLEKFRASLAD